jgi:PhnB protein
MTITTTTHLNFDGAAREALTFYQSVFGGETAFVSYGDAHADAAVDDPSRIMWGHVVTESGLHVMAYDVQRDLPYEQGVNALYVSVSDTDADELTGFWGRLVQGGTIEQDLAPAGWSPLYGKVRDRFGVVWVLDVPAPADH